METKETNLLAVPEEVQTEGQEPFLKIIYGNSESTSTIDVDTNIIQHGLRAIEYSKKSEYFLLKATKNLIRKWNFIELNESLEDDEITEEEFGEILEKDAEKYTITLRDIESSSDVLIIADIIDKIGYTLRDFTTDEVSELFSVKENQLVNHVDKFRNLLKDNDEIR